MGKRSAAEANVDDDAFAVLMATATQSATITSNETAADRKLVESPVPFAWRCSSVEPAGAYHTRVRTALPKQLKLPLDNNQQHHDDDDDEKEEEEDDQVSALSATLPPPLIAPRPRRVVSPELIFQSSDYHHHYPKSPSYHPSTRPSPLDLTQRRSSFRPIGAGRPDVENPITSPPSRAANPVVLDMRFKNMQRLDLKMDARVAPLQPFHRPQAQRRAMVSVPPPQHDGVEHQQLK